MAESLQVVDVTALTRPVRFASREAPLRRKRWHPVSVRCLGCGEQCLSEAAPALPAPQSQTSRPAGATVAVLLLHGLGHNQSWSYKLQRRLTDDGFVSRSVNYHTFSRRLYDCADIVAEHIWEFTGRSAAPAVHVVAHSIGGLVLRAAINRHPEIQDYVATGITIGSPHRGTPWAYGPGSVLPLVGHLVRELRPGSDTLRQIDEETVSGSTRWVSMYSVSDEIVPMYYGQLDHPELEVQQIEYRGLGHYGLMYHPLP